MGVIDIFVWYAIFLQNCGGVVGVLLVLRFVWPE